MAFGRSRPWTSRVAGHFGAGTLSQEPARFKLLDAPLWAPAPSPRSPELCLWLRGFVRGPALERVPPLA